jgi:hypothetical protein
MAEKEAANVDPEGRSTQWLAQLRRPGQLSNLRGPQMAEAIIPIRNCWNRRGGDRGVVLDFAAFTEQCAAMLNPTNPQALVKK